MRLLIPLATASVWLALARSSAAAVSPPFPVGDAPAGPTRAELEPIASAYGGGVHAVLLQRPDDGTWWITRVDPATRKPLDPPGIPLHAGAVANHPGWPAGFAYDGTGFRAFWRDGIGAGPLFTAKVSPSGSIAVPATPLLASIDGGTSTMKAACAPDGRCLVAWGSAEGLVGLRVDAGGEPLDAAPRAIGGLFDSAAVAYENGAFVARWSHAGPQQTTEIWSARVAADGAIQGPTRIAELPVGWGYARIATAASPTQVLVFVCHPSGSYWQRQQPDGTPIDPSFVTSRDLCEDASVAAAGTTFVVGTRTAGQRAAFFTIDPEGARGAGTIALAIPDRQLRMPRLSSDGQAVVAVTQSFASGSGFDYGMQPYAARFDATGALTHPPRDLIYDDRTLQERPATAFSGSDWLTVWSDTRNGLPLPGIYGARATPAVLDPSALTIAGDEAIQRSPALAWSGSRYLAVWVRKGAADRDSLRAVRLSASGAPIGAPFTVREDARCLSRPAVAADAAGSWMVTWIEEGTTSLVANVARVDAAGALVDTAPITLGSALDFMTADAIAPRIASPGSGFVVAWTGRNGSSQAIWLTANGAPGPIKTLAASGPWDGRVGVACRAGACLLGWNAGAGEGRAITQLFDGAGNALGSGHLVGLSHVSAVAWDGTGWIVAEAAGAAMKAHWLDADGAPIGTTATALGITSPMVDQIGLAGDGAGRTLLTFVDDASGRAHGIVLTRDAPADADADAASDAGPSDAGQRDAGDGAPSDAGPDVDVRDGSASPTSDASFEASPSPDAAESSCTCRVPAGQRFSSTGLAIGGSGLVFLILLRRRARRPSC
jgi:hypothetical protein